MTGKKKARLILENGIEFTGNSFGFEGAVSGEVVFNTAMTGYPESLTDPSYCGQILVATYPLIGNYGVPDNNLVNGLPEHFESDRIQISALIVSDYSEQYSHWNARLSLGEWLEQQQVPGISGIDTRALTKILREKGSMPGKIMIGNEDPGFSDPNTTNLVAKVSTGRVITYGNGETKILLVDCGVKYNIIRHFVNRGNTVIRVPWDYDYRNEEFDGLFISNGPGDPKMCETTINHLTSSLKSDIPVFGICLGNQLLALASGADTFKLKYGHRSHNQPVLQVGTNKALITSQNHGFAIDPDSLSGEFEPWFINLNDGTNEGIRHRKKPVFSVQFHPEASSGPTDSEYLFDEFLEMVRLFKNN